MYNQSVLLKNINDTVEILIELIKHGADLSLPYVATFSSQMQFATSLERDAATRMIEVIYRRLDGEGNVAVTPYDMAYVMGHKEIVRLLERQFASQLHENSENIAVNTKKQGVKSANKNANIKQQPLEVVEGKKTKKRQFGDAIENKGSSCKLMRIDYLCNRDNVSLFSLKNEVATKPVVQRQCGYN